MDCEQKLVMSLCACSVIYMAGAMLDVLHVTLLCHVAGMMDCERYIVHAILRVCLAVKCYFVPPWCMPCHIAGTMDCEAVLHVWYVHCSPVPYISFISKASEI